MKRRALSFIIALALCLNLCPVRGFAAGEGTDSGLCPHHLAHTDECGYDPGSPDASCAFACPVCPIEDLIDKLPSSASVDNSGQVQAQLSEIYALYDELTFEEQQQVDLSPCALLLDQLNGASAAALSESTLEDRMFLEQDRSYTSPHEVSAPKLIDTNGHTLTGTNSSAIRVVGTGELYLAGTVVSKKGAGVEVQSGGFLSITKPDTAITGTTYALDIASGAEVHLATGTYKGNSAAIRTADGNFAALLEPGCAYFNSSGEPILAADVAGAKTVVVGPCTDHLDRTYTHTPGALTHTWTCRYCGTTETETCTFTFDNQNGIGTSVCGSSLAIDVDESALTDLVYNGTTQPADVTITVTLTDGSNKLLVKDTDYTVVYEPRKDVGEITVTVTGITFNGTFTKTYSVAQDQPVLAWDISNTSVPVEVDYDGSPVEAGDLPPVKINIQSDVDNLQAFLQYSYKKPNDSTYIDGLPTNAGTYDVMVSLPEMQNFQAAESAPITLIIHKISPIVTDPVAVPLEFNGAAQELVTAGTLHSAAARDGVEIKFATSENGTYSTTIPTGVNAGDYPVWYQTEETENYIAVGPLEIDGVEIQRKPITPVVTLSDYTYLYDGGWKEPTVTVKDGDDGTTLLITEYDVAYENHRDVGTATVTVSDKAGGNYAVAEVKVSFQITSRTQESLTITNKPNTVTYGDKFTLGTSGGSGNGDVTWEIIEIDGQSVATVDPNSGQVTIVGPGSATVRAVKSGKDPATNIIDYEDATASWTFTAVKKPVVATVTAEDKTYDGKTDATINAVVEEGVLPGDTITISNLSGAFRDKDAGTDKPVDVNESGAVIEGVNFGYYDISYSSLTVTATISKKIADIMAPPTGAVLTYDGTAQELIANAAVVDPSAVVDSSNVPVEYALSEDGAYSTDFPKATDAGTYTVWYRVQETTNYTGLPPESIDVEIKKKPVSPVIKLSGNDLKEEDDGSYFYIYDGAAKTPDVTLEESGGSPIPASEYTVKYANNKNAGTATVTVTSTADSNYKFDAQITFTIKKTGSQLTSSPQARDLTYTGKQQELVSVGNATGGQIVYSLDDTTYDESIPKRTDAGDYVVYYKIIVDDNHENSTMAGSVTVTIKPKRIISPIVEAYPTSVTYNGREQIPTTITVKDGNDTIPASEYSVTYRDNTDAGTATVIVSNANGGNYIVDGTGTFTIEKANVGSTDMTAPSGLTLPYNGTVQELAAAGSAPGGTMVYSLTGNDDYSPAIPTAMAVGSYTIWYMVQGDDNHNDSAASLVSASIDVNTVENPVIQVMPESVTYNGKKQEPVVTVIDDKGFVIDGSEYTVTYEDENGNDDRISAGRYTVTIKNTANSNYEIDDNSATFEILRAGQESLVITGTRERVYYGDRIQLNTTGGNGSVTWTVDNSSTAATITNDGFLTITGVGSVKVTATSKADGYTDQTAAWVFYAEKKPVTAVVTAASKFYDGKTNADVTAKLQSSDLVSGDTVDIILKGNFGDPNAGTDKKVYVDSSDPTITGLNWDKYAITYPDTTTASILKANIDATDITEPVVVENLEYTGNPQALVKAGSSAKGTMEYSLDNSTYSTSLPTGINADDYDIWYRVTGGSNYNDTVGKKLDNQVTIAKQNVTNPVIEFTPNSVSYDGAEHKPSVTVKDKYGREIPNSEYTVVYDSAADWKQAGDHDIKITGNAGGNYNITTKTETFTILPAGQSPLSIVNQRDRVQYGDTFKLSTEGGSGTGDVTWESSDKNIVSIDPHTGEVTALKSGGLVVIKATKAADDNYGEVSATWTFNVEKKPVTAIVTANNKVYDTRNEATLVVTWKAGDLLNGDDIDLDSILEGTFDDANVGTNKPVTIKLTGALPASDKYEVSWNTATTASITPATASVSTGTTSSLTYTGSPLPLISGVTATNGTVVYSRDGIDFTRVVPTETNAGTYTFWYKALADENYKDSPVLEATVIIAPKSVTAPVIELSRDTFEYDGNPKEPGVVVKDGSVTIPASEYNVSYTNNIAVGTATVTIESVPNGNYIINDSKTFEIEAGAASLKDAPQAVNNLTYNGYAQELVTPGTAVNGRVVYSTSKDSGYSASIPKETNAGTYTVWYKVEDENGNSATEPLSVPVTIRPMPVTTPTIVLDTYSMVYTGSELEPKVLFVIVDGNILDSNKYTVTYVNNKNVGSNAMVIVQNLGGNYQFASVVQFEIIKGQAEFSAKPEAVAGLVYNGKSQKLVSAGVSSDGTVYYSLDGESYSTLIPTGVDVGEYVVLAKVRGNSTHEDSDIVEIPVSIGVNEPKNPKVQLSGSNFSYTGKEITPNVTVVDDNGDTIPASEYTVTYGDNINAGIATVKIESKGSNYNFKAETTFTIVDADQIPLAITGKPDAVYYGDTLNLGITGGSGTSGVTWTVSGPANKISDGTFEITSSGSVTITATQAASDNYKAATDTWTFNAKPKPVTAIVTAKTRPYNGDTDVDLTVTISSSSLVSVNDIPAGSVTATGHFTDKNAETNKTVIIDDLTIPDEISVKYAISYRNTTTASITQKAASVTTLPEGANSLEYNGSSQDLLDDGGAAMGGTIMYSLDGVTYSPNIPKAKDADTYTVWYKAVANDANYKDSSPAKVENVRIVPYTGSLSVLCSPSTLQYDGNEKTPTVVVLDSALRVVPENEYSVSFSGSLIEVGKYTVTIADKAGGNYDFSTPVTETDAFEIVLASQYLLSIITDIPTDVCYGDTFRLSTMGGSGTGAINWSIKGSAATINNGVVTVTGTGAFTVEAYQEASGSYSQSNTASVTFSANPKPITPVVTAEDKFYDGNNTATLHVSWKNGDLVNGDVITLIPGTGQFASEDVGTNKQVTIMGCTATGDNVDKYTITWPESTTASINKANAAIEDYPEAVDRTYDGTEYMLVTPGSTKDGIGTIEYSRTQYGVYSPTIPTATNAGKYTVWYMVADSMNYTGTRAVQIDVEIKKETPTVETNPTASGAEGDLLRDITLNGGTATGVSGGAIGGTFAWENDSITVEAGETYNVIFTPDDTVNYEKVTFQITVTISPASGSSDTTTPGASDTTTPGTSSTPGTSTTPSTTPSTSTPSVTPAESSTVRTTIQNGTASTVVSAAAGSRLVREAAANQNESIVIKPEITGEVTKTEVSIPASTVSQIKSETNAALTVSAPIADVTIPNGALDTLGRAGGTVSVAAEQVEQSVVLTLTAGGQTVESVPGGLTLTVPVEDAAPGTVAVLVNEDGTRETLRKVVVEDGKLSIPLDGSATVEIVDNSKDFTDVSDTDWAAEAIAFASAHELFNGTSETTFSPDEAMSRGMLATVLYSLEGSPELETASAFSDVSSGAWYAEGVAWAAENGVVGGYGDGQFGPDDSITREQFAVMLWRYMGSPEAESQALDFDDADQAGSYALEALCWAVENGILNGFGNGLLAPEGTATRAQAAQMLKNFMENT